MAAAERLGANAKLQKIAQPSPAVRDARSDPVAVVAVCTIILFQTVGSLIGLTRDVLPAELQGAAVMDDEPIPRVQVERGRGTPATEQQAAQ